MNTNINRARLDNLVSPAAAVIVKPRDNLSIYGAYSISYLPSTGDQFSALNRGTLILQPQKFENKEAGLKWNINPKLLFPTAIYPARPHQPADPGSRTRRPAPASRFRTARPWSAASRSACNGYVTDYWQAQLGYAYTDARIAKDLTRRHGVRAADPGRQSRAAGAVQPDRLVEQVQVHGDVERRRWRHLFRRFLRHQRRYGPSAELLSASMPASMPISTRTGRRSSRSRTSSTRTIGPPPTATTTFRRGRDVPCV